MIERLKIILLCVVAVVLYGILLDQITIRVCIEYFTVFHPPVFATRSPTLLALGWGIVATWWAGILLGVPLALVARAGSRPQLSVSKLLRPVVRLLALMAGCALMAGVAGFFLARRGLIGQPEWMIQVLAQSDYPRFVADWCAHGASYASGVLGGVVLCILQYRKRIARSRSLKGDT